jgi:microcystin-dependent protein
MGEPYIGEIRMVGFNFAPAGWMLCQGQLLPIDQNEALFNLIGTTYGGDGQATFALPNLQSRVPMHQGSNYVIGESGGTETVTLTVSQIPPHNHPALAQSENGNQGSPANGVWAASTLLQYTTNNANATMNTSLVGQSGGSQPHDNMMPFLTINFIISLYGVYPTQS